MQKIGAFKIRGALNTLLSLKEQNALPKEVVAFSSGNHAQAVAYASKMLNMEATITSPIKQQATKYYGAEVINTATRKEATDKGTVASLIIFYFICHFWYKFYLFLA